MKLIAKKVPIFQHSHKDCLQWQKCRVLKAAALGQRSIFVLDAQT